MCKTSTHTLEIAVVGSFEIPLLVAVLGLLVWDHLSITVLAKVIGNVRAKWRAEIGKVFET